MGSLVKRDEAVPGLVVHGVGEGEVVGRQVEVLLHVGEAQAGLGVVDLGVQREDLVDDGVGDGGEEDAQVGRDVLGGVDARVGLRVGLVQLVGGDDGAGEVEAALVELGLVRVGDDVAVDAGLELVGVGVLDVGGGGVEGVEVDAAHALDAAARAAGLGGDVQPEGVGVLVAGAGDEAGGHDVGAAVELLGVAGEAGHLEEDLGGAGGETNCSDLIGVTAELGDVPLGPLEGVLDIPDGGVGGTALVQEGGTVGQASHTETVVVSNVDEVLGQIEETFGGVLGLAATGEASAVRPDHHGQVLALGVGRGPDIHVQAVLFRAASNIGGSQVTGVDLRLNGRVLGLGPAEVAGRDGGEADVLVLVVSNGLVAGGGDHRAVVESDGGHGAGADGRGRGRGGGLGDGRRSCHQQR